MELELSQEMLAKKAADECYNRLFSGELTNVIKIKSSIRKAMADFLKFLR